MNQYEMTGNGQPLANMPFGAPPSMSPPGMNEGVAGIAAYAPLSNAPAPSAGFMGLADPQGPQVAASQHTANGTGFLSFIAWSVFFVVSACTLFIGPIAGLIFFKFNEWWHKKAIRIGILGTTLRVSPQQLPEIHRSVATMSRRLGLAEVPEVYIIEASSMGAYAMRITGRNMVFLTDDMVEGCLRNGDIASLNFVIAHELAHQALGHTNLIRAMISMFFIPLRRVDELSADSVALALIGSPDACAKALMILLTGPALIPYLNRDALIAQAREVVAEKKIVKKAERTSLHPMLLRRVARFYGVATW